MELTVLLATPALAAAALVLAFVRWQPGWSTRRRVVLAGLPVPLVGLAVCVWIFIDAAIQPRARCGVDACAMAMAAALVLAAVVMLAAAIGWMVAWAVARLVRNDR